MLFYFKTIIGMILILISNLAFATPLDVDKFLRTADLTQVIFQKEALNLTAQVSQSSPGVSHIDEMSEFVALGVNDTMQTIMTAFDAELKIQSQTVIDLPWIGVARFVQSEIPAVTLQEGFDLVKICMAKKRHRVGNSIARVTIYKNLQSSEMIYDYVFTAGSSATCQEVLFVPGTGDCELGMKVRCYFDVGSPSVNKPSQR